MSRHTLHFLAGLSAFAITACGTVDALDADVAEPDTTDVVQDAPLGPDVSEPDVDATDDASPDAAVGDTADGDVGDVAEEDTTERDATDATADATPDATADDVADVPTPPAVTDTVVVFGNVAGLTPAGVRIAYPDVAIDLVDTDGEVHSVTTDLHGGWQAVVPPGAYEVCWTKQEQGECGEAEEFNRDNVSARPVEVVLDDSNVWGRVTLADGSPCVGTIAGTGHELETLVTSGDVQVRVNHEGTFVLLDHAGSATFTCEDAALEVLLTAGDTGTHVFENSPPTLEVFAGPEGTFTRHIATGESLALRIAATDVDGHELTTQILAPDTVLSERDGTHYVTVPEGYEEDGVAVTVVVADGFGGYAVQTLALVADKEFYTVSGQITDAHRLPIEGITVRGDGEVWTASSSGYFDAQVTAGGRGALTVEAPGYVPRVLEISGDVARLDGYLVPCTTVTFNADEDVTLVHPSDERLQVSVKAGSLTTPDGAPVSGSVEACLAMLDASTAMEMFGTMRIAGSGDEPGEADVAPGTVGYVEPITAGYMAFTQPGAPGTLLTWPQDNPEKQPTMMIQRTETRPHGDDESVAAVSFDFARSSWRVEGPSEGDIQALVTGSGTGGGYVGGVSFVPRLPEKDFPYISSCVLVTTRGYGNQTVTLHLQDALGATVHTQHVLVSPGTTRIPGLPVHSRVRVDGRGGAHTFLDTGSTTTRHYSSGTVFPTDCGGHAIFPVNGSWGDDLLYAYEDTSGYTPTTNVPNGGAMYTVESWMVDNGWAHTGGVPHVSPRSGEDADVIFDNTQSVFGARRVYANMTGTPGDADVAMLLANGPSHGAGIFGHNWLGIAFRRAIPTGPRAVQFFWFDSGGNQRPHGGIDWWSAPERSPHSCQNCHGGVITDTFPADANLGATMIPFDISNMEFSGLNYPGSTRAIERSSQEAAIRMLNEMLLSTDLAPDHRERILGLYGVTDPAALTLPSGATQNTAWRPMDWASEPELYELIQPTCMTCHGSRGTITQSAASFIGSASLVQDFVCRTARMPVGSAASIPWWNSVDPHRPNALVEAMHGVPGWTDSFCNY